jgi:hypothetical protein
VIDDFFAWLPGNDVIDWMAIAGTAFCVGGPIAFGLWALRDKFRPSHGEHWRPIDEPAPELVKPVAAPAGHRSEYERIIAESGKAGDF